MIAVRKDGQGAPPPRRQIRVVAALVFQGGSVLAQQRKKGSAHGLLWEFPGGKVELGESEPEALIRECREELAVEMEVLGFEERIWHAYPEFDIELALYRCRIIDGVLSPSQAECARFVPLDELEQLPFTEADRPFVARLARRLPGDGDRGA